MVGHDKMGIFTNHQAFRGDRQPLAAQFIHLRKQDTGINNHPIADHTHLVLVEDAGWDNMKNIFLPFNNEGMSGIISALEPNNIICMISQQINNLSFSFVTPLGSNHHDTGHGQLLIVLLITQEKGLHLFTTKTADRKQVWYYSRGKEKSQIRCIFFGGFGRNCLKGQRV